MASKEPWNRGRKLPPEVLSPDEVKALMGACSTRAPTGIRNRGLIVVLYRALLRIDEALALKPKDLNRDAGTVRVLHGKGDKSRTVGMDDGAWVVVEIWLERRAALGMNGRHSLFCSLTGKRLLPSYCRALFTRLAEKANIEKRVHPHGLRHSGASEMRCEGIDVGVISKQLGHSSIATTSRYLDHIAPAVVVEAVRRRKWEA